MRTNISLADKLLAEAMTATGQRTKRATIEQALRTLIRLRDQIAWIRQYGGDAESTSSAPHTRTNIEIDLSLLGTAMGAADSSSKKAVVEEALRIVVRLYRQRQALEDLHGIGWEGDLDAMRRGWSAQA